MGKGTLLGRILKKRDHAWLSVSATTRSPRPSEVDGVDYAFVTTDQFESWINDGGLLEWAKVHAGKYYGTPKQPVLDRLAAGDSVFLEIDTQGALQLMDSMPEAISIFIEPPSIEVLRQRLKNRGTENQEQIDGRISVAQREIEQKLRYNYRIINDNLDVATQILGDIIDAEEQNSKNN